MKDLITTMHPFLMISGGVANLAMALWILCAAPKSPGKLSLVHMAVAISGYLTCFGMLSLPFQANTAFRIGAVGEVFVHQLSTAFYAFSVFLLDIKAQRRFAMFAVPAGFLMTAIVFNIPGFH